MQTNKHTVRQACTQQAGQTAAAAAAPGRLQLDELGLGRLPGPPSAQIQQTMIAIGMFITDMIAIVVAVRVALLNVLVMLRVVMTEVVIVVLVLILPLCCFCLSLLFESTHTQRYG